ncbi:MAG: hypothetical protein LBB21_04845 [Holosporaceae bacterium]|jgi:hypothetical protein|nr:hypothetical protein [Holosporaceae bacterium]
MNVEHNHNQNRSANGKLDENAASTAEDFLISAIKYDFKKMEKRSRRNKIFIRNIATILAIQKP